MGLKEGSYHGMWKDAGLIRPNYSLHKVRIGLDGKNDRKEIHGKGI